MNTGKDLILAATLVAAFLVAGGEEPRPVAMRLLRPGAIRAERWLKKQLVNQRDGLTGHAEELYADIGKSDWLTGAEVGGEFAWERGPYYAKGLLSLAYALDDAELKAKAKRWAEAYFASQREDGDFGPKRGNWWANMLVLHFLRDWHEATGDERVVPFLERYFRFQREALKTKPLGRDSCWAACRGGDELEVVLWLYEKTGNPEWLDFAEVIRSQTCDWAEWYLDPAKTNVYASGGNWDAYERHIVNLNQGLKSTALFWRMTGAAVHRDGWKNATRPDGWLMRRCGRPDGMVNGTEPITDRASTGGTELCAQAERILSDQVCLSVFGDAAIGDDMERIAYNTLPATLDPQIRGIRYYNILNQPACVNDGHVDAGKKRGYGFENNGAAEAMAPGPDAGFGCCRSNFHMAWPKFVQSMWMKTADGLAATAYGPCRVEANGFKIYEDTDYPFRDTIKMKIERVPAGGKTLAFRIPAWTKNPGVKVNGAAVPGVVLGEFCRISREWKTGDEVELRFPCEVRICRDGDDAPAYVRRGALLFAWAVPSERRASPVGIGGFKKYELLPKGEWNVALKIESGNEVRGAYAENFPENPFDPATPPIEISLYGFRTTVGGWGTFCTGSLVKAVEPPSSPVAAPVALERLTLVPLGSTQTRITLFPWH